MKIRVYDNGNLVIIPSFGRNLKNLNFDKNTVFL